MDLKDITDSREVLEAKPHPFLTWFIYILIALILTSLTWAYLCEIEEYVKVTGSVRPGEKISRIRNTIGGKVDQVNMIEGMWVNQGDILYTIEVSNMLIEREEKIRLISQLELETEHLNRFQNSILQGTNLFDSNHSQETEYYNQVQKYFSDFIINTEQIENNRLNFEQMKVDVELSINIAEERLIVAKIELSNLETLLASVESETNLFNEQNTEFYNKYKTHHLHLERLRTIYQQRKDTYNKLDRLLALGGVTWAEVDEAKIQKESAKLDLDKYQKNYQISLQDSIRQTSFNITELTNSLEKYQNSLDSYQDRDQSTELMIKKVQLDMIVQTEERLLANRNSLNSLLNDLRLIDNNIAKGVVKAPIDGVVNLLVEISKGDLVIDGSEVAIIVPDNTDYVMQLMIHNQDIANISIDQRIRYRFHALPYRDYGELKGTVQTIGADARIDNLSGFSYYLAEATVDDTTLQNHKGQSEHIKAGMVFDAYMITHSKPVIRWLLEKINFID